MDAVSGDHPASRQYLDQIDQIRDEVDELLAAGWPLPRVVWRARSLYAQAWRTERVRYRESYAAVSD